MRRAAGLRGMLAGAATVALVASCADAGPPDAFEDRTPEIACGEVDRGPDGALAGPPVDCFEQAMSDGGDAELVVRVTTVEGDPVVHYYRTVPDGAGIDLFVDATQDEFGSQAWEHGTCPDATGPDALGECEWH